MKLLILTTAPITAQQLQDAIPEEIDPRQAEITLIAPALHESALHFWFSDADDAIARAEEVRRASVRQLDDAHITARSDTGESDPVEAINDALQTFSADRIVLFTHRDERQRYREQIDPAEIQDRFGIPTYHAPAGRS